MFTATAELGDFRKAASRTVARLSGVCRDAAKAGAEQGRDKAKQGRWTDRTGKLRREIEARMLSIETHGAEWEFSSPTFYAPFLEYGTKAHWIRPKTGHGTIGPLQTGQSRRAKTDIGTHRVALRWYSGNGVHFAKEVFHPGTQPVPFMGPAGDFAADVMISTIWRGLDSVDAIWD